MFVREVLANRRRLNRCAEPSEIGAYTEILAQRTTAILTPDSWLLTPRTSGRSLYARTP
jgi:hypothetical protein